MIVSKSWTCAAVFLAASAAMAVGPTAQAAPKQSGSAVRDINPNNRGPIAGVGIEGHDIIAMSDQMARDIMSVSQIAGRTTPPRIIVDDQYFRNESIQRLNKSMITDRLRVGLNRAAAGRMLFVGREYAAMVEQERQLKRDGMTDTGTVGMTQRTAGVDYRLTGKIQSLDQAQGGTGMVQRYNMITFELIDLETGIAVWSNIYEFERAGADDISYQ